MSRVTALLRIFCFVFQLGVIAAPASAQTYWTSPIAGKTRFQEGSQALATPLRAPSAVARDQSGNVYIADSYDARILRVSPTGVVTIVAGTGFPGFSGDGGPATRARISARVTGIAIDRGGALFFTDNDNYRVRKVAPDGTITTVIGTGEPLFNANFVEGGPASGSVITPWAVAVDNLGNLYVSDATIWIAYVVGNYPEFGLRYSVRRIDTRGTVTTIAGGGPPEFRGDGGPAKDARVGRVEGLALDAAGNLYLSDTANYRVRRVTPDGVITTIAGNGQGSFTSDNILATTAGLTPSGLSVDANGDLYIADSANSRIRRVDARSGFITTVAGSATFGFRGDGGSPTAARLGKAMDVHTIGIGEFLIADTLNGRIRQVARGTINSIAGTSDGDGGPALNAYLNQPLSAAGDAQGAVYIADRGAHTIRRVVAAGTVHRHAGDGYPGYWDGDASLALFRGPMGLAIDSSGAVYVADTDNHRVRKIANGTVTTIAGTGTRGYTGDGGGATGARLDTPTGVALDTLGNVYIADWGNSRVRRISPNGVINTIAGNGSWQFNADNIQATLAQIDPLAIAVSRTGEVFIADRDNHRIRRVDATGMISTVAGGANAGFSGDGGPASGARLRGPSGIALDGDGNLFIADYDNFRVRRIDSKGVITTIAGNGLPATVSDLGPALETGIDPFSVSVDPRGNLYIAEPYNDRVRRIYPRTIASVAAATPVQLSGTAGLTIDEPLTVRVLDTTGTPVQGLRVIFSVTSGSARMDPPEAVTDANGNAKSVVLLGNTPGQVVVTAIVSGMPPVVFRITVAASRPSPRIDAGGVVSAGLTRPPIRALSTNSLVTVFGQNFSSASDVRSVAPADRENGRAPTRFAGACIMVGETRAPVFVVAPTQITFQVPRLPLGTVSVQVRVVTQCGTPEEQRSEPETVEVRPLAPEFFYFLQRADGTNPVAAANAITGQYIGLPGMLAGVDLFPAKPGDIITVYATGLGRTGPDLEPGEYGERAASVTGTVRVRLGDVELVPGQEVLYLGITPFTPGLYQLNLKVPVSLPDGDHRLVVSVNGVESPAAGVLIVRR